MCDVWMIGLCNACPFVLTENWKCGPPHSIMEEVISNFDKVKLSAFSKFSRLTGNINDVTLGPNSVYFKQLKEKPQIQAKEEDKKCAKNDNKEKRRSHNNNLPIKQVLSELESKRQEGVQIAVSNRLQKFKDFSKSQKEKHENEWLNQQQAFIQELHSQEDSILEAIQQYDNRSSREQLANDFKALLQNKMRLEEQLERTREKQRMLSVNTEKIQQSQIDFRIAYQEIIALINSCASLEELKAAAGDKVSFLKLLPSKMEEIVLKCKSLKIGEGEVQLAGAVLERIRALKAEFEQIVGEINARDKAKNKPPPEAPPQVRVSVPQPESQVVPASEATSFESFISKANLVKYDAVVSFLERHAQTYRNLLADESQKQFKFDCKKAINIPVNGISAVSPEHLRDKYNRLASLISGKNVVVGDRQLNASRHPEGIAFCVDLLAKKFVLQGDLMVSSNPDSAFYFATVMVSLWNDFPDFGKLLLAYFYKKCPYTVPFYVPKTEDQSDEEYYTSLGYVYSNGQIEKQDKFLKRLTGTLRLYFAVFIASPKRGQKDNPHNVTNAWTYLVSVLKLEPQLDVTATILCAFLETVGYHMDVTYGRAFRKLVRIIEVRFLPALKRIDSGGPVSRLQVLLQDFGKKGRFDKPNGIVAENFW